MRSRFARSATLGVVMALAGSGLALPAAGLVQEEEGEPREREERRARVMRPAPGGVLVGARAGGYLGVRVTDVDEEEVERLNLAEERGALVVEVVDETPAAESGLRADDVIVRWNDEPVESAAAFSRLVRETPPGRAVRLGVIRDGAEREIRAELEEPARLYRGLSLRAAPEVRFRNRPMPDRDRGPVRAWAFRMGGPRLGVSVTSLSEQLGEYFGVEDGDGALITNVGPETPAARAGLRAGDVILSVAGEEVDGPGDIGRILRDRDAGPVDVRIMRDRQERDVTVEVEEPEEANLRGSAFLAPGMAHPETAHPEIMLPEMAPPTLDVAPLPSAPPLEVPHVELEAPRFEIEVAGLQEMFDDADWDGWAEEWETLAEDLAERTDEWQERSEEWGARWQERSEEMESRWREWAERWEKAAESWSEAWEDRVREWEESLRAGRIEVTYRAEPAFL